MLHVYSDSQINLAHSAALRSVSSFTEHKDNEGGVLKRDATAIPPWTVNARQSLRLPISNLTLRLPCQGQRRAGGWDSTGFDRFGWEIAPFLPQKTSRHRVVRGSNPKDVVFVRVTVRSREPQLERVACPTVLQRRSVLPSGILMRVPPGGGRYNVPGSLVLATLAVKYIKWS